MRRIPNDLGEKIFREADAYYRNGVTNWFIVIKRLNFQNKERDMALTYARGEDEIIFITLHPLKENQKADRIESRRWILDESASPL